MSNMKFQLNPLGVSALLRSPEMQAILEEKGQGIAERAGEGFELTVSPMQRLVQLISRVWLEIKNIIFY